MIKIAYIFPDQDKMIRERGYNVWQSIIPKDNLKLKLVS